MKRAGANVKDVAGDRFKRESRTTMADPKMDGREGEGKRIKRHLRVQDNNTRKVVYILSLVKESA